MNRSDFTAIMNDPGKIDRKVTGEVKEILDLFPWFHSAHLMLLKGLHSSGDVKFENQLRNSAIHIPDRETLYYFLMRENKSQAGTPAELINGEPDTPATIVENVLSPETEDHLQVVIESGRNSSEIIKDLEKEAVLSADPVVAGPYEKKAAEETIIITNESESDESASVMLVIDDGDTHYEETVVFMDPSISSVTDEDLLEIEEKESQQEEVIPARPSEPAISRKELQSKLIDNFILLNPRIEPSREKSDKPNEDISKPYTEERGELVSETLARIYTSQGYYSRAMELYEKLCLKYPEKSSYFAAQIEKVKALIK